MAAREIEIQIGPDGTVSATVRGVKGPACMELAKQLTEIIGTEVSNTPTAEFYEPEVGLDVDVEDRSR